MANDENSRNELPITMKDTICIRSETDFKLGKSLENIPNQKEDADFRENRRISYIRRASCIVSNLHRESKMVAISIWTSFRGIVFASIASLLFAFNAAIVKHLTGVNPALIALFRFGEIIILSMTSFHDVKVETIIGPRECRIWLVLRGLTGATSLYLRYMTIQLLPLANATVITQSVPVFVCVFAHAFLGETCGIFHIIALGVTLVGIGFTAKLSAIFGTSLEGDYEFKPESQIQLVGLCCGIGAAIVGSLTFIVLRKLKDVHHSVVLFNFAWVASIEMAIITYFMDGYSLPVGTIAPWLLVLIGVFSYYAQVMFTKALQVEEAGIVAMFKSSCDLVLAFLFQICVFRKLPDLSTVIGSILVASAVVLTSFRKYIITLPPDHLLRKWFSILLK